MRKIHQKQQTLTPIWSAHEHAKELEAISEILDSNPTIAAVAAQDLIDPEKDSSRGAPGMTADQVLDGNPADSTLIDEMLDRHIELYGRPPRQAALVGGFASRDNVQLAKHKGVQDICFSKRRGFEITDMVKSSWVFKQLRRFRAGVEGCISFLKRCFGLGRCTWRGLQSFKSYV